MARMRRKHLLVLTDRQLFNVLITLSMEAEDYAASGEDKHPADKAAEALRRQRLEGLSPDELVWAMEEIVRQDRRRQRGAA